MLLDDKSYTKHIHVYCALTSLPSVPIPRDPAAAATIAQTSIVNAGVGSLSLIVVGRIEISRDFESVEICGMSVFYPF